ncbi:TIGR02594 family protein [Chryseobacterium aquaticum]|uniref:TIGR02594 family protein n=1 Tax=Chryseobacterium aquaticum TaxID=452084 RepID=UPI003F6E652A
MAKKGYIIVEGAKAFCSSSVANNSKGTAVPMQVKSQKKKLGKNKYFAQEKPIATYLDDKADSFGGGNGFGNCKGSDGKPYPCKAKCNIKYKDYYENVEFNKSMKVLLGVSTGTCPGYGVPGTIQFATTGQSNNASQIDVKEADEFSVANASPQWETKDPADKTKVSVSSISMISPIPITELKDTYYYIQQANNSWSPFSNFNILTPKLTLKANFKGEVTKIIWTLFKGEGVKDKVKTFIGLGATFNQDLDKVFQNLEEGKYKIEAYGGKPGDAKCTLDIEVVKDFVKKITIPASSIINIPVPVSLERKVGSPLEQGRILNKSIQTSVIPSAYWRIKEGNNILHNTFAGTTSPNIVSVISSPSGILVTFKNKGKYIIEAFTNPNETKPETATIEIKSTLGIETIDHGSSLLRYNDNFSVWVKGFNAIYIPDGAFKNVNWYLKKEGTGRLRALENSASFKALKINKRIDEFLFRDAGLINGNYFGKYSIEAYANPLGAGKEPQFSGGDCFNFEVIRNSIDQLAVPATTVPQGTKVKYTATARISPLISGETIRVEVPQGVTNNGDGTLTFTELGEFTISAHMEGQHTDPKVTETKIKVAQPKLKRALWAYGTGVKRTETGYEEETYGFLEIEGLQNQALKVKIWVKGETDGFYQESAKYMLEEKAVTLNSEGKASFQITTNATYKEKIEKAIPKTADNPNPQYRLIFTIEPQIASTADIIFPSNFSIEGTKSVAIQGGTTLLEVLESNEELTLTSEQKITKILFSTEDGKDIQRTMTYPGKTHKLQVHTVNMQEEVLKVDILKEIAKDQMQETGNIISALECVLSSAEGGEKVGKDGLLEFPVKIEEDWLKNVPTFIYLIGQVSQQFKDPVDENKKIWKVVKAQYAINGQIPADLITTEDKDKVGIKAVKKNGEAFTQEEMAELRKRFLQYNSSCLKVVKGVTEEATENDVVPVMVEMAEAKKQKNCWCDKPFLETDVRSLVNHMRGKEEIWESTHMDRESFADLTIELNKMFSKYSINKCIQKIAFLANVHSETSFFRTAGEESSSHASSGYKYKGRGIQQLTGDGSDPVAYAKYDEKVPEDVVTYPELIATKLHLAVDSGGWFWSEYKKISEFKDNRKYSQVERASMKFKREYFSKALGKSLNDAALLMEDEEEKYYFLICKMLNGYSPAHKLEVNPNGWDARKTGLSKLKTWFKYDKNMCKEGGVLPNIEGRAPWMKIVLAEAKKYGGYDEGGNNELNKRIKSTYFTIPNEATNSQSDPSSISWCAVFASWCLQQVKFANPSTCRAREFDTEYVFEGAGNADKKLSHMRKITEPVYGCIVVWKNNSKGGGHVAFYYGKTKNGNIIPLGGNQGSSLQFSNRNPSGDYGQSVVGYFLPEDYPDNPLDKFTPEELNLDPGQLNKSGLLAKNGIVSGDT